MCPSPSVRRASGQLLWPILAAVDPLELLGRFHAARGRRRPLRHDDDHESLLLTQARVCNLFAFWCVGSPLLSLTLPLSFTGWGNVRGKSDKKLGDYGGAISDGKAGNARFWRGVLAHSGEFWHVPIIFGLVLYSFYVVLLRNLWHTFEIENWSNGVSVRKSGSHYSLSILSCHI